MSWCIAYQAAAMEERTSHGHPERDENGCMIPSWRKHSSGFVLPENRVETCRFLGPFLFQMLEYDLALSDLCRVIFVLHTAITSEYLLITMFK